MKTETLNVKHFHHFLFTIYYDCEGYKIGWNTFNKPLYENISSDIFDHFEVDDLDITIIFN